MASDRIVAISSNEGNPPGNWPLVPMELIDQMVKPASSPEICQRSTSEFEIRNKGPSHHKKSRIGFFDMPAEIRLQIYENVNELHPVVPRQLALGYPDYYPKPYFLEPIVRTLAKDAEDHEDGDDWALAEFEYLGLGSAPSEKTKEREGRVMTKAEKGLTTFSSRRLLSPHRPRGYIPHALLRTCRRLYREARYVPFRENEFVFATWFSTGTSTALAFISGLKAWQWAAMTYVRLEIPLEDIDGSDKLHLTNWEALCEKWAFGLRGLRLTIVHLPNLMTLGGGGDGMDEEGKKRAVWGSICPVPGNGGCTAGSGYRWIDAGLKKLEALRRLEVELKTTMLSDNQKLDWCEGLKGMLSRGLPGQKQDVEVVCVRAKVN